MDAKAAKVTRAGDFAAARGRLPLPAPDDEDEEDEPGPAQRTGRIPRLAAPPTREQLHAWLADVHKDSRVLAGLDQRLRALHAAACGGARLGERAGTDASHA